MSTQPKNKWGALLWLAICGLAVIAAAYHPASAIAVDADLYTAGTLCHDSGGASAIRSSQLPTG